VNDPTDHLDDLLRRANPVDEARLPLPVDDPQAQLLYEKITGTPYAGRPKRSARRFGTFMAAIAALAAIGGSVAYASLRPGHVTAHLSVECYGQDSLDSPAVSVSAGPGGPIVACADAWAAGHVGRGPVPLLAACVAPTGIAAVFPTAPGANVCAQLNLTPLATASASTAPRALTTTATVDLFLQVRAAVVAGLSVACLDGATAMVTVKKIVADAGLEWSVTEPTPFPADRPCASPAFDEARREIILVGIPRRR
jgi:hypothetical protein